jgi:uncharacterized SAM-binding protein YcdF (DUF218 family)
MIGRVFLYGLRGLLGIALVGTLWVTGLILFTHVIPSMPQDTEKETDGIVIFTGGKTRLKEGLSLFEQGKAKYLLISGVNPTSTFPDIEKMPFRTHITLGYKALDTEGNAEETASWAHKHQIKTLRLITSNYHMPRSLFVLHQILPQVQILPHPVVGRSFLYPKWWLDPSTLNLVVQEYNKFLFALIRRPFEDLQDYVMAKEKIA